MSIQICPHPTTPTSGHIRNHGPKGSVSCSANPDEDWTKIVRRRAQNRNAQRNHRNKVKRRLEDLEKQVGLLSVSRVLQSSGPSNSSHQHPTRPNPRFSPTLSPRQLTSPLLQNDDGIFANRAEQDGSRTPPLFTPHTYPDLEDFLYAAYSQTFCPMSADYLAPVPVTLPSMMQLDPVKRAYDDTLTPFNMACHPLPAVDIQELHWYESNCRIGPTQAPPN